MRVSFAAAEQLKLQLTDPLPRLQHYLRQPKRLVQAIAVGVEVMPCRFEVSPDGVKFLGMAELAIANF